MKTFNELQEGVYDPNIFKAIFLAGGPGSGKSYVVRRTTGGLGMKIVNSDDIYEKMLKDAGLEATPEDIFSDKGQEIRVRAKATTKRMQGNFLDGRLGLIIDGTGKDYDKIAKQVQGLKSLGYECYMIFVNTSLDTAQERNKMRSRTLPEKQVEVMWKGVQKNIGKFQSLFGSNGMIIVDNNDAGEDVFNKVWKRCMMLVKKKVTNHIAKSWISKELAKKKR
jgi:predicted kinase|tara:strand:+ start:27 stop:692 length:666 start_codon:yes stop_codon:yes gene_type:complete